YVRNNAGKMVPYASFASGHWTFGSPKLERYNSFPSINIWGEAAPGRSSGDAMQAMEDAAGRLPDGIGYDWTGLSYQERMASSQAPLLYAFSVLVIFLCLAALYESWPIPISILMTLPLGVVGGVIASSWMGLPNDVYFQIGLLTLLGLATKNAILIVQFARARVDDGMPLVDATLEAAKLRLRPIVMTSLAFGFGVLPMALANGAGSGAQRAIGIGVVGGVISSTFLVTLFAPLFYVLIYRLLGRQRKSESSAETKLVLSGSESHE
ncbi:MAG: efflux RND transporter permease subunit, partial [Desulfobacterales bacterium]|nr:efflux RND transporter permease subunit [Desulfobacterales bacterium]